MRKRTRVLLGVLLGVVVALGLTFGMSTTVYADNGINVNVSGLGITYRTFYGPDLVVSDESATGFTAKAEGYNDGDRATFSNHEIYFRNTTDKDVKLTLNYVLEGGSAYLIDKDINGKDFYVSGPASGILEILISAQGIRTLNLNSGWGPGNYSTLTVSNLALSEPTKIYPLWVGGTQVTEETAADPGDRGWSYTPATEGDNPTPATLTLNGATISGGSSESNDAAIYAIGELTINVTGDNTVIGPENQASNSYGISVDDGEQSSVNVFLNIKGSGTLTSTGNSNSKSACGIRTFNITPGVGDITIGADTTVNAVGQGSSNGLGISCRGNVNVNGALTAVGSNQAIYGTVKNAMAGTGWSDAAGTEGKALIEESDQGQDLSAYKRAQFPAVVTKFTVVLTGGANATASGGATTQVVEEGAEMADVTYAANDGYHFEAFDAIKKDGATAELKGGRVVVSGKPTADVEIAIPDAVRDAESAPAKVAKPSTSGHPAAGTLDVSWKSAEGAKSYEVQWRKKGGKWQTKAVKSRKSRKYTISGLKKGTLYEVRVRAKAGSKSGKWSPVVRRWLRGPSSVKAKASSTSGAIKVSWKGDKKANGGFKAYVYAKKGGKLVKTAKAEVGATSVTVSGLKAGKRYYVRVRPIRTASGKTYTGTLSGYKAVRTAK